MNYRRVLLKISGQALGGVERGIRAEATRVLARQVAAVARQGVQLAVVCGGGNILRGADLACDGAQRSSADTMGMLATVINGLALCDALEREGLEARLLSAIEVRAVTEPFERRRALAHLERGRVLVLAGGLGVPLFTTDTAAAQRAIELSCDVLLKATKVDGVYTADPVREPAARRLPELTHMDLIEGRLGVMDATAVTLCMEHRLPIVVFDLFEEGNLERVIRGEDLGTKIGS